MATDAELRATAAWLRTLRQAKAQLKSLRRSFELEEQDLKERVAEAEITLRSIYTQTGPVTTVAGSIGKPTGWVVAVDDAALLEWAKEHRPGIVKETVTQIALKESGAVWKSETMLLESGEIVEGIHRTRSDVPTIKHVGAPEFGDE